MRGILTSAAVFMVVATGATAQTGQPSSGSKGDYSVEDVVKGFSQKPAANDACHPDADGVCQPSKDSRGFSLEDSTPAPPVGAHAAATVKVRTPAASRTRVATVERRRQPEPMAAPVSRRDLLISFRSGSSELTERSKTNARTFVAAMNRPELAGATFEIGGHTDATGSPARNRVLAQQRADAVRQFMVDQGADGARLKAVGYGSDQPADPNNPDAAVNRRVEARRLN
jgi:outer membrane protein OmpA-like peptidoglycan-associated protein